MTRILLSTATVALVAFGACLLIGRQECIAVSNAPTPAQMTNSLPAMASEVSIDRSGTAASDDADANLAQAESPFQAEPPRLDPSTSLGKSKSNPFERTIKVPVATINYEDRVVTITPLQQQYSVLMLKRAQRMSEEELTKAIEELEAELKEQDEAADAELQKAVEILNQLQENSGGTPAARRAAEALPVLNGIESAPKADAPFYNGTTATSLQPTPARNPIPTY